MGDPTTSSGEEDGDAEWKAAIQSIAATTTFATNDFGNYGSSAADDGEHQQKPQKLKHYQIKAQKLLDDILERNLVMATDTIDAPQSDFMENDFGVRLFKNSPLGIVFDHRDEYERPKKRPKILRGRVVDEKPEKLRKQLRSVAVDGKDILAAARDASQKSLARLVAKDAAAKAKAKREEERVAELKKIRGERWLPSIAREMQLNKSLG